MKPLSKQAQAFTTLAESFGLTTTASLATCKMDGEHPRLIFQCELLKGGKVIWSGPYHMGIGHVPIPKRESIWTRSNLTNAQQGMLGHLQRKPHSTRFHTQYLPELCDMYAKLANRDSREVTTFQENAEKFPMRFRLQNAPRIPDVQPVISDILPALLLDGACRFDNQSFEDWCAEFGGNTDSIKDLATYNACEATGRALAYALPMSTIEALREAAQEL